ncbi:MAG: hypothetical protein ACE5GL_11970, partial [Calditrichia bacterium]
EIKKPVSALETNELIPSDFQGITTDVVASGPIFAFQDPRGKFRPAPGGVSIGHRLITAGTLGCLVKKAGQNYNYILSNNHVLANSNEANTGDAILQPGPYDGGKDPDDQIAILSEFVPIQFDDKGSSCKIANSITTFLNFFARLSGSKSRLQAVETKISENLVDCAIAEPLDQADVKNEILNVGNITGVAEATLNMAVKKMGRTTGFTTGTIEQIDVTARVNYGTNKVATFVDQIMAGAMSQGGDSGSVVLNSDNKVVGLLFAGSNTTTIINRIQNVFQQLGVTLA